MGHVDFFRKRTGVFLADKAARHLDEIGVAEPIGAVGKRELHRLGCEMDAVELRKMRVGKLARFQHVENFEEMNAAGNLDGGNETTV